MRKIIFLLAFFPFLLSCADFRGSAVQTAVEDTGNITVYFCPRDECEEALVSFLDSAESTIHCALFEIGLDSVQGKLREKAAKMDVEVVTDNDYLKKFNESFVQADSWGLMHNKFCVVDGKKVLTGSMNPTINDAHKNNNNLLIIHSPVLAGNYEAEFQEMWGGFFKKGETVRNPRLVLGNASLENYFCPEDNCAYQVKEKLKKAKRSIYFMTFSFTHEGIANILLLKSLENVSVRGVMERRQITEHSQFDRLSYQLGSVLNDGNKYNLHHKVFIIDGETVITGSFNPTEGGNRRNDENLLIISDKITAKKFVEEFETVWMEAETSGREI